MPKAQHSQPQTANIPLPSQGPQAVIILARLTATSPYKITCTYSTEAHATYIKQEIYKEWRKMKREGVEFSAPMVKQNGAVLKFERREGNG